MFICLDFSPELSKNKKHFAVPFYNKVTRRQSARIVNHSAYNKAISIGAQLIIKKMKVEGFEIEKDDVLIVDGFCVMTDMRSDSHNLIDAIMDMLEDATKLNDRRFMLGSWKFICKRKKKYKEDRPKSRLTTSQKGSLFLKIQKMKLDESLSSTMEMSFMNLLTLQERTEFKKMIDAI